MNTIVLLAQFNERLLTIESNRKSIAELRATTTKPEALYKLYEADAKLMQIEAELHIMMQAIASLN